MKQLRSTLWVVLVIFLQACSDDNSPDNPDANPDPDIEVDSEVVSSLQVELNPTGYAPLTASLQIETTSSVSVEVDVVGRRGNASTLTRSFPGTATSFELDIIGLYADYDNELVLRFYDGSGTLVETQTVNVQTAALIDDMPQIVIDTPSNASELEFNFVNYFGFSLSFRPQRAFIFDQFGDIRWYLDFITHPTLNSLFYDNGMNLMQNGNLVFGDGTSQSIFEIDMMGRIINFWSLRGNGFHHHVIEKPDGNFLVTINDVSKTTVEDVVVEIDRSSGLFANSWDLNVSLDNTRRAWPTDLADLNIDWFHANAVEYSADDDAVIISGRTQGIVKLNAQNEVGYILAPHRDWNTSGNGTDLTQFLLTPLDANDEPITDVSVLDGSTNHPDFEWSWYQHSPILMPNGNLMVFDNGDNRNYTNAGPYSRAVEYEIDEVNKTIKQVWSYGKERGEAAYARIVSKVSYLADKNAVLFTPGSAVSSGVAAGKVIEVDYNTKTVLFEATVFPPNSVFNISFHNVQRIPVPE
ncbi:MAG: aryl-sulfate sulfotransferase [Flavobacteriaceae bacterium]|nr:aryl-sulfate sulfotransferase [Flavobacteriaceae bacterium]